MCTMPALAGGRPVGAPTGADVDRALQTARTFLIDRLDANGVCLGEYPPGDVRHAGRTALVLYALTACGADPLADANLTPSVEWLVSARPSGTYGVSMRLCALTGLDAEEASEAVRRTCREDLAWLLRAAGADGRYGYGSLDGAPGGDYDNSNAQMAALAVASAASAGAEVPASYWQTVRRWWQRQQQPDGGWGYRIPEGMHRVKSYGSMTAAGLATLMVCSEHIDDRAVLRCAPTREDRAISSAWDWLAERYSPRANPGKTVQWYYYWLFSLQRVGLAGGRRTIAGHDWYAQGAREVLRRQRSDGSWGLGDRVEETCFAMLFLARGRRPIVISKLKYPGRWNARPRDAAHFARWMGRQLETTVNWQVVDVDADPRFWRDCPILYVSGAGPVRLSDKQVARLRQYVLRGGMIVSEAACNNGDFTLDMRRVYARLFPGRRLEASEGKTPLAELFQRVEDPRGVLTVSNQVRILAVHAPRQLSLSLHRWRDEADPGAFQTLANAYMLAAGSRLRRGDEMPAWPDAPELTDPRASISIARLRYEGNWNPEPLAWERLSLLLAERYRIRLSLAKPVAVDELSVADHTIAVLTGTEDVRFSSAQKAALRRFLAAGGTLLIDAAGGSRAFAQAVQRDIVPLVSGGYVRRLPATHEVYRDGPTRASEVRYRPAFAAKLGDDRRTPRVVGVEDGRGIRIFLSREDWTAAMTGYAYHGLSGYSPDSAVKLLANVLTYASRAQIVDAGLVPVGQ